MAQKILIYSLAYYPHFVSGAEAAIREITDRIDVTDIDFHLVTLHFDRSDPKEERIGNVHVHRVGFGPSYLSKISFLPLAAWKGRQLHKTLHFSGVWAMMTYMLIPTLLMRLLGAQVPYALTLQDGDPYEKVFGRWFIRPFVPLLRYGFRRATVVQTISQFLSTWPQKLGYQGDIEIIYNGADPRDVTESVTEEEVNELKKQLGKKEGDIYLINTARLEHQKAFDIVIRALLKLPAHISLLIVGSGREEHALKALANSLNVEGRVKFIPKVDRDTASVYRKAADIFVGPSRSEGLGNAFLSAMASRMPVIATQVGGLAEYIFDPEYNEGVEQTAWAVPPDDPEAIAESVRDIMEHPEVVHEVTDRARNMVVSKFNWDMIAREMNERVFKKLH